MSTVQRLTRLPIMPLAGLVMIVFAALSAIYLVRAQAEANRWVTHTVKVEARLTRLVERVRAVESAHRGYLLNPAGDYDDDIRLAAEQARTDVDALVRLTADNSRQERNVARLMPLVERKIAFVVEGARLTRLGNAEAARAMIDQGLGRRLMSAVQARVAAMIAVEEDLLARRSARVQWLVRLLGFGLAGAVLLVVIVAHLTITDARRRFRLLEEARDEARAAAELAQAEMQGREQAESQVRQMQKMESIGQLTGGIAHDFNNMLAIVIGSLDMAERRKNDPERVSRCLENAREGAERAASLTARLLAFSRQQPLAPVAIDANRLVINMSELLRRTLGEQVSVEAVQAGGLWRTYADPGQLENALLNLAVNARDAMPDGGRLTIETANAYLDDDYARTRSDVEPGQYVTICISDTGTGMSAQVIDRAFDPFFTTKAVGKGTGLGLSQVFGFVKQSGGHIAIYSEVGEGTTVKLYLPRYRGPVVESMAGAVSGEIPMGRSDEIILVVEDEQRVRHISVDALRDLGYTALSAGSGAEALKLVHETPSISLLFTDVVMPEMNGRRLADEVRVIRPNLPVLYTTGYTRNAVVHNGMLDAGVAFLPKPFTVTQLGWKVREVLDGRGINRPA